MPLALSTMCILHKNIVYNSFIIALYSIVDNAVYYSHHKGSSPDNRDSRRQAAERKIHMKATTTTATRYVVRYEGGESRYSNAGIDYMLAEVEGVELYAEAKPVDGDEWGTYDELKAAILEQATEHGIPAELLVFPSDD